MSDRQTRHTINVHLGDGPFHMEDFMHTTSPFVSLRLGHNISVFVSTEAQIDELQAALHTVRLYLLNGELDVGSGAEGRP